MEKQLKDLASLVAGSKIIGDGELIINDIEHDSRKIDKGALFVCLDGARVDGHKFIEQAKAKGAVAIMTQRELEPIEGMSILQVPNVREALQEIVPFFHDYPGTKMRIIGVTGTNGKTSITYMLRDILRNMGCRVGIIGTIKIMIEDRSLPINNTTPDIVDLQHILAEMARENIDYVVMEVSSHALAQGRVAGVEFDTGIFTNLTQDHLDYHKTLENYKLAKAKLFDMLSAGGMKNGKTAIINLDDEAGKDMLSHTKCRGLTYGINSDAFFKAKDIKVRAEGASFTLAMPQGDVEFKLQLTGIFNIYNVMAAIGAALAEGVPLTVIKRTMEAFKAVPGRFELVRGGQDFSVIVDYAHTPDGLENILQTAREIATKRIITVFGCGGDRDNTKRPIMGKIGATYSDVVVVTSDNPRTEDPQRILDMVVAGVQEAIGDKHFEIIADRREAIFRAIELAEAEDILIIAGKGHENYQILKDKTIHFDDKEVALEGIEKKRGV